MQHQINVPDFDTSENPSKEDSKLENTMAMLVSVLETKFHEYSGHRSTKEAEWVEAERQYAGIHGAQADKKQRAMGNRGEQHAPPVVNITRQKTNIAISRMQDIQFPMGGDYNFQLDPTEVPELQAMVTDTSPIEEPQAGPMNLMGQPMPGQEPAPPAPTVGEWASSEIIRAREASEAMRRAIQDHFTECDYGKRARRAMDDMCRIGTAVLKGPVHEVIPVKRYNRLPTTDNGFVNEVDMSAKTIPTVQWVDPRLFYPDPTARPGTSMEDCYEVHPMTRQELIKLSRNPAYMKDRIRTLLGTEPDMSSINSILDNLSLVGSSGHSINNRYIVKEYHGPIEKEVLLELDLIDEEQKEDNLLQMYGEVWFANGIIIRVSLSPVEGCTRIPYYICPWEEDRSSVFGHGIPYLMRHSQRVVNSSWQMLLDNAGLTAGPQIVLNREMIRPASPEEGWRIEPMKVWFLTEYGANVNEAMQFVNVPTQQEAIANITELAMSFADIESSIPQIQAGEIPSGNNTLGGVAMVLSASHIVQQRVSERWDDNITVPLVKTFYDWEMQYGENPAAQEADIEVKAGGATERIDKQAKAQDIERIIGLAGTNPNFEKHIDLDAAFRELAATTRAGDIILPVSEVIRREQLAAESAAAAGPPPEAIAAQAQMLSAQAKAQEAQTNAQIAPQKMQLDALKEEREAMLKELEINARIAESQTKLQLAKEQRELKILELSLKLNQSREQILANFSIAELDRETDLLMKSIDMQKFREEMQIKKETGKGI